MRRFFEIGEFVHCREIYEMHYGVAATDINAIVVSCPMPSSGAIAYFVNYRGKKYRTFDHNMGGFKL